MVGVQVISTSTVVPVKKVTKKDHSTYRIELTPWDLQLLSVDSIQKGILFHRPAPQQSHELFGGDLIHHLKCSLARTLDFFPLLAGRLGTMKLDDNGWSLFIDCNGKGAQFTHAIVQGLRVIDILEPIYMPCIVHSFFPLNGICNYDGISKPLLAVQVTELDDGFFIGCTINHCVADGTSFWHFFNSWSNISSSISGVITKPPILKRWFPEGISCPIRINLQEHQLLEKYILPPLQERVFHFTKENIAKLKARANLEIGSQGISSLQALLAHLWRSIIRCRGGDPNKKVSLKLLIGARARLQPPLTDAYFGNAVHIAPITATAGKLSNNGLGWVAWEINKVVALQTDEKIKSFYKNWVKTPKIESKADVCGDDNLVISSSPRFNVYGTDFGWGKPLAVRSGLGNKSNGKITIFPGVEEGSIDIEACLVPETLHAMGNDAEFMEVVTI